MENIASPLRCLIIVQRELSNGASVNAAIKNYLQSTHDDFSMQLRQWYQVAFLNKQHVDLSSLSPYRRNLIRLLYVGLRGAPILQPLEGLGDEMRAQCRADLETQLQRLPIVSLIPLMFLQVPAFLLLLLGPLIQQLLITLSD